jgi:hypothetical protein
MKITVRPAGGFVGYLPGLTSVPGHAPQSVETTDLAPERRAQLERLVQDAGIIDRPLAPPPGYPGAERLITIEAEGKSHTARFPEGAVPDNVQQLIDAVHAAAAEQKADKRADH